MVDDTPITEVTSDKTYGEAVAVLNVLVLRVMALVASANASETGIGDLVSLETTAKDSVVAAINELHQYIADGGTLLELVGLLEELDTTNKSNVVAAINELHNDVGDVSSLDTATKASTVAAINELVLSVGAVGNPALLKTKTKQSVVAAVNELKTWLGIAPLRTSSKTISAAINELVRWINSLEETISNTEQRDEGNVKKTAYNGAAVIPTGSIPDRPSAPETGYFRFNYENDEFEGFTSEGWIGFGNQIPKLSDLVSTPTVPGPVMWIDDSGLEPQAMVWDSMTSSYRPISAYADIGNLSLLQTDEKSDVVSAINELVAFLGNWETKSVPGDLDDTDFGTGRIIDRAPDAAPLTYSETISPNAQNSGASLRSLGSLFSNRAATGGKGVRNNDGSIGFYYSVVTIDCTGKTSSQLRTEIADKFSKYNGLLIVFTNIANSSTISVPSPEYNGQRIEMIFEFADGASQYREARISFDDPVRGVGRRGLHRICRETEDTLNGQKLFVRDGESMMLIGADPAYWRLMHHNVRMLRGTNYVEHPNGECSLYARINAPIPSGVWSWTLPLEITNPSGCRATASDVSGETGLNDGDMMGGIQHIAGFLSNSSTTTELRFGVRDIVGTPNTDTGIFDVHVEGAVIDYAAIGGMAANA